MNNILKKCCESKLYLNYKLKLKKIVKYVYICIIFRWLKFIMNYKKRYVHPRVHNIYFDKDLKIESFG